MSQSGLQFLSSNDPSVGPLSARITICQYVVIYSFVLLILKLDAFSLPVVGPLKHSTLRPMEFAEGPFY